MVKLNKSKLFGIVVETSYFLNSIGSFSSVKNLTYTPYVKGSSSLFIKTQLSEFKDNSLLITSEFVNFNTNVDVLDKLSRSFNLYGLTLKITQIILIFSSSLKLTSNCFIKNNL